MPLKYKKYDEKQDRRRKLTSQQREEIREKHKQGGVTHKSLATEYGVSRSLVTIIVNPQRAEKVHLRMVKHWREYQTKGKEWADIQKEFRKRKRALGLSYPV